MKQVLWVSRHEMSDEQLRDLWQTVGQFRLLSYTASVHEITELMPLIQESNLIAAVLPPLLLRDLVKAAGDKPVIISRADRIPCGTRLLPNGIVEPEFMFIHKQWLQLNRFVLDVTPFDMT